MAAKKKPAKKAAKRKGGGATVKAPPMRPTALPPKLALRVRDGAGTYTARARGMVASCTTSAWAAARALATKLGYSAGADVSFVGRGADTVQHFEVVELES